MAADDTPVISLETIAKSCREMWFLADEHTEVLKKLADEFEAGQLTAEELIAATGEARALAVRALADALDRIDQLIELYGEQSVAESVAAIRRPIAEARGAHLDEAVGGILLGTIE